MSPVLEANPEVARAVDADRARPPLWQIALLVGLSLWLYAPVLAHLVAQWWHDPNFSHGFFVPVFSGFVIWQNRLQLARLKVTPSRWGILLLGFGLCLLLVGQLGAELFLSRCSLLLMLAGGIVLFLGWNFFRALLFPWAFLLLMIPIPAIIFNQITFPLQLLASRVASGILPWLGVPVLREGNVIVLPAIALEVADACSGIRSLMSLATLAVIYGYLMDRQVAVRAVLALASVPIAVAANSLRVVGTGLLVQYWDPNNAQGFFHEFQGWLMFVASLFMLYLLHRAIRFFWPEPPAQPLPSPLPPATTRGAQARRRTSPLSFALAAALILLAALTLQARGRKETIVPDNVASFPAQIDNWTSDDIALDRDTLEVLGPGHFLLRQYRDPDGPLPRVDLFIAYFPSQRTGDTIHSPKNCLPGAGWIPEESTQVPLSLPGHAPFPVNRYVIAKAGARQLVLYWYWAHDRGVASEYWAKYYLVKDSIRMNRSDGALVRLVTPMFPGETSAAAQQRLFPFTSRIVPLLDDYIPR
jgi:exosortase D (VPLPA-CTERM-specific)